jgi:dihydroorotate dehydrogenase electron transfer subunit
MKQFIAAIVSHKPVSDSFFELMFAWDAAAGAPMPGQFCTIRVSPYSAPLLRRPFAFSAYDERRGTVAVLYKKRGPATELLAEKSSGASLDVIGPLGNDFLTASGGVLGSALCVAGGTGLGPMLFLCGELRARGANPRLILGFRTASQAPERESFGGFDPDITTDDGTMGTKGTPLDFLSILHEEAPGKNALCACGPKPLLRGCNDFARSRNLSCFVSLEQTMACGVGACMGCAVKVHGGANGFARACTEGPVFDATRIAWT